MSNLFNNILTAVILAIITLVAGELIPYLTAKKDEALTAMRKTRWSWAADIIDAVVRAVEQTASEELHGMAKRDKAVTWAMKLFQKHGITMTTDEVQQLIEAAVQAMNAEVLEVETDTEAESYEDLHG